MLRKKEDALQKKLTGIFKELREKGVPEGRLPTVESVISHLMEWVDEEKRNNWIENYSNLEKVPVKKVNPEEEARIDNEIQEAIEGFTNRVLDFFRSKS